MNENVSIAGEVDALPGAPTEKDCGVALLRTSIELGHIPDSINFLLPIKSFQLAVLANDRGDLLGQVSVEALLSAGAKA